MALLLSMSGEQQLFMVWRVGLDVVARRPKLTEGLENEVGREFAAGGESAERSLVGHGERELLRRLIDALPEELRQPLVLTAIEEMTSREVADRKSTRL